MKEEIVKEAAIRRFLLGDVDEQERQRIEGLFISEPEVYKKILIAEDDLIEDYLDNSLASADRDKFLAHYGSSAEERRSLRITRAIRDYAVAEATTSQTVTLNNRNRQTFLSVLRARRPWFVPVAAVLTIAFIVAVVWLLESRSKRSQENNRRASIEREIEDLNETSRLRGVPAQTVSLLLPPVSVRSVGPQTELRPQTDIRIVELHLVWIQKQQYPTYRAVLRRVGNADQYAVSNLHLEKTSGGNAVPLRLPIYLLNRGQYQINLIGIDSNGAPSQSEEYGFAFGG